MKKIINPWKDMEGYNCFGCSPDNEAGVRMEFYEDGDEVVSIWKPRPEYHRKWKPASANPYRPTTRMWCCGLRFASRSGILLS